MSVFDSPSPSRSRRRFHRAERPRGLSPLRRTPTGDPLGDSAGDGPGDGPDQSEREPSLLVLALPVAVGLLLALGLTVLALSVDWDRKTSKGAYALGLPILAPFFLLLWLWVVRALAELAAEVRHRRRSSGRSSR